MPGEIVVERTRRHGIWVRLLFNAIALFLTDRLLPGVHVEGILGIVFGAVVLAAVNAIVRPVLLLLTLPITLVTLGLFVLIVNALMLLLAAWLVGPSFRIDGFGTALLAWLLLAVLNGILSHVFKKETVRVVGD